MGMSSSQARLLSLTGRMHDIELKAQRIQADKLRLANESNHVYEEYVNALEAKKLMAKMVDSNGQIGDVLMTGGKSLTFGSYLEQYAMLDKNGKTLVSESFHNSYSSTNSLAGFLEKEGVWVNGSHYEQILPAQVANPDYITATETFTTDFDNWNASVLKYQSDHNEWLWNMKLWQAAYDEWSVKNDAYQVYLGEYATYVSNHNAWTNQVNAYNQYLIDYANWQSSSANWETNNANYQQYLSDLSAWQTEHNTWATNNANYQQYLTDLANYQTAHDSWAADQASGMSDYEARHAQWEIDHANWVNNHANWEAQQPNPASSVYQIVNNTGSVDQYDNFMWASAICYGSAMTALSKEFSKPGKDLYDSHGVKILTYSADGYTAYNENGSGTSISSSTSGHDDCYRHVLDHLLKLGTHTTTTGATITVIEGTGGDHYSHWYQIMSGLNDRSGKAEALANIFADTSNPLYCSEEGLTLKDELIANPSDTKTKLLSNYYYDGGTLKVKTIYQKIVDLDYAFTEGLITHLEAYDQINQFTDKDIRHAVQSTTFDEELYNADLIEWQNSEPEEPVEPQPPGSTPEPQPPTYVAPPGTEPVAPTPVPDPGSKHQSSLPM